MPFLILIGTLIGMGVTCSITDRTPPPIKRKDINWSEELLRASGQSKKAVRKRLRVLATMDDDDPS
ncbi:MAG: hypothetical protein GX127_01705 [Eubacteriaceae bacterium]|nr:hypothetical protein [Eubacteriaceae bacterium]